MIMNTISRVEFARRMSLSKGRVTQLVERGMPTAEDGRISFKAARRWYRANIVEQGHEREAGRLGGKASAKKSRGVAASRSGNLVQARAEKEAYVAKLKQLELAEVLGKVVQWEDVRQGAFNSYRAVRDQLFSIPDRGSAEFAVEDDPRAIRERLAGELELASGHVRIEDVGSPSKV